MIKPNKITVVFLPGRLCDQRIWQSAIDALSEIINPIFVDLRFKKTLDEMMQSVGDASLDPFILCGFSMGGYIAQEFAIKFPDRILGLAIVGSSAHPYTAEEMAYQERVANHVKHNGFNGLSKATIHKLIYKTHYHDNQLVELIQDMAIKCGKDVFLSQHMATANRISRLERISQIAAPILVIAGREDKLVPIAQIEEMRTYLQNPTVHIIEECGHMIPLETPDIFNALLAEWVRTVL